MKKPIMLAIASAAALGLLAVAPAAAAEEEEFERPSRRVAYDDLNLDNQRGAWHLIGRIEFAAESVCGARGGPMTLAEYFAIRECVQAKMEGAVADVNNANVTALYYGRRPSITITGR